MPDFSGTDTFYPSLNKGDLGMGIRILMIEDENEIADFVLRGLREEGFTVERESDGDSGWYALRTGNWDVVLLDWLLPNQDGITILKKFRETKNSTPVLLLTARDTLSDKVKGLNCGADDYLCKPFVFEELLARVRALSRRQGQSHSTNLSYKDINFDLISHKAQRAGSKLDLKAKEEALLLLFLRHPEEVLSRTRIYEKVWGDSYDGVSNTLEVHIGELRRKLEALGSRVIQTYRGKGYLFGEKEDNV